MNERNTARSTSRFSSHASALPVEEDRGTPVNHPSHYNAHPAGVECIAIAEAFNFNLGSAIKYVWRAGLKTVNPLEDLKKARRYLDFEIARLERMEKGG